MRNTFVANRALLCDRGPAPEESGFLTGGHGRRAELFHAGLYKPRNAMVTEGEFSAWAAAWPHSCPTGRAEDSRTEALGSASRVNGLKARWRFPYLSGPSTACLRRIAGIFEVAPDQSETGFTVGIS
jgi:hypothetical protein